MHSRSVQFARRAGLGVGVVFVAPGVFSGTFAADDDGKSVEALAKEGYWGKPDQWAEHEKMLGKPMPELSFSDWVDDKKKVTPEDMKGKIVVIDYWATWCGPCIRSIPHNNEVAKHYADK